MTAFFPPSLAMPSSKPDKRRMDLLKAHYWYPLKIDLNYIRPTFDTSQDFYKDILENDFREQRMAELAKREGIPSKKFERAMQDKEATLTNQTILKDGFKLPYAVLLLGVFWGSGSCQVPVTFSFVDVHPQEGLNGNMVRCFGF